MSVYSSSFIAPTHPIPTAGLGLNTALLEAHNLAWKLGLVLNHTANPSILGTYAKERHAVAKELVDMDRQLVTIYADLEKQNVDDFESEATAQWLKKLQMFQAKNYAVSAILCSQSGCGISITDFSVALYVCSTKLVLRLCMRRICSSCLSPTPRPILITYLIQ